jgi:hypothetical protein
MTKRESGITKKRVRDDKKRAYGFLVNAKICPVS